MSSRYHGLGVSPGLATGPVLRLSASPLPDPTTEAPVDVAAETARAEEALDAVADELDELARRAGVNGAALRAMSRIARDPDLAGLVAQLVRARRPAARAVYDAVAAYRDVRAADPLRPVPAAAELDDVRDRTVAHLLGRPNPTVPDGDRPFVLVARDLTPSTTAGLDPQRVLALVTERGGPTSHTAVLARALGIPAVVACPGAATLADGTTVVVDGGTGAVVADPDRDLLRDVRERRAAAVRPAIDDGPGRTADGHPVGLYVAFGSPADLADAAAAASDGVGVLRTEFLFSDRTEVPTVSEQVAVYREVFAAFAGRTVTVRTLDVGADKPLAYVPLGEQDNPALGVRGLRVARRDPGLLRNQLVAIARAAAGGGARVRVMAPMVATVGEAAWFASQAHEQGIAEAGVMVEVPAAALRARDLLRFVDFLSVGSNDLAQYAFAADRTAAELADLLDPWQPALLDLVATVTAAGAAAGRPVTVCGSAATDPLLAPVLVGLGADGLSTAARGLPEIRAALAAQPLDECRRLAELARGAGSAEEARERVGREVRRRG